MNNKLNGFVFSNIAGSPRRGKSKELVNVATSPFMGGDDKMSLRFSIRNSLIKKAGWRTGDVLDLSVSVIDGMLIGVLFPNTSGRAISVQNDGESRGYVAYTIPSDAFPDMTGSCGEVEVEGGKIAFVFPSV